LSINHPGTLDQAVNPETYKEQSKTLHSENDTWCFELLPPAAVLVPVPQVRWAKLRGTPGTPAERLVEAERDTGAAEGRVGDTKIAYEALVSVMTEELNRWQKERAADVHQLLIELALAEVGGGGGG
jgi:hypothetical protein